jgi:uroporphyrinogen decarboxylase
LKFACNDNLISYLIFILMLRKERFLAALRHEETDCLPMFDFLFQQPLYQSLIGSRPEAYNGTDAVNCALALDHDGVWVPFGGFSGLQPEFLEKNVYRDEWGTTYKINEASWPIDAPVDYPIKSRSDLKVYRAPDPTLPGRDSEIRKAVEMPNDNIAVLGGVGGPLSTAWLLLGFEKICYSLYEDPGLIHEVMKISNAYFKEAAKRSVEAGCVGMWVSEDLGDSKSAFFSIDDFREHFLPYLNELIDYIDGLGVPVLLHSCGNIGAYLDDLAQTRIASVHPLQRTAGMDLKTVKEKYGSRFCIIGNIDSSKTLPFGTIGDVKAEVAGAVDIGINGGGYILASDHSLHDGIPVENIVEMFRFGREYSNKYFKS